MPSGPLSYNIRAKGNEQKPKYRKRTDDVLTACALSPLTSFVVRAHVKHPLVQNDRETGVQRLSQEEPVSSPPCKAAGVFDLRPGGTQQTSVVPIPTVNLRVTFYLFIHAD